MINPVRRRNRVMAHLGWIWFACLGLAAPLPAETCTIANRPVLLYKIINHWGDCLADHPEAPSICCLFCGRPLQYSDRCRALVGVDAAGTLTVRLQGALAGSLVNPAPLDQLKGKIVDIENIGEVQSTNVAGASGDLIFRFEDIGKNKAERITGMENDLGYAISGTIGGLHRGRVILGGNRNDLHKTGPAKPPATVALIRISTGRPLAVYSE